jgi:hypothetical protein
LHELDEEDADLAERVAALGRPPDPENDPSLLGVAWVPFAELLSSAWRERHLHPFAQIQARAALSALEHIARYCLQGCFPAGVFPSRLRREQSLHAVGVEDALSMQGLVPPPPPPAARTISADELVHRVGLLKLVEKSAAPADGRPAAPADGRPAAPVDDVAAVGVSVDCLVEDGLCLWCGYPGRGHRDPASGRLYCEACWADYEKRRWPVIGAKSEQFQTLATTLPPVRLLHPADLHLRPPPDEDTVRIIVVDGSAWAPAKASAGRSEEERMTAATWCAALRRSGELHGRVVIGFDTETKPTFRAGEKNLNPICLVQLATPEVAVLFRLVRHQPLPSPLRELLSDPTLTLVGQEIGREIAQLHESDVRAGGLGCTPPRLTATPAASADAPVEASVGGAGAVPGIAGAVPGISADVPVAASVGAVVGASMGAVVGAASVGATLIELAPSARAAGCLCTGVAGFVAALLGLRMHKPKSLQMSNWEMPTLSEAQLRYAATDAWVCWHALRVLETPELLEAARHERPDFFYLQGQGGAAQCS